LAPRAEAHYLRLMGSECHHPDGAHPGLHGSVLQRALTVAEARCTATQERLTPPRRRVLQLLLEANAPLKAYDLIAVYGEPGVPAKPPTVYRALEFLERLGFAHRIESLNAYVPCRLAGETHSAAFLICDCCGTADEFEPDFQAQIAAADARGYDIRAVTLEVRGLCPACRA